jgi:hypothetical protein
MEICDFCSSPRVVKRFECMDFDSASEDAGVLYADAGAPDGQTNLVLASKDFWAACEPCRILVETENIDGLVKRAMEEFERQEGWSHSQRTRAERHLRRTYQLFFQNRIRIG